MIENHKNEVPTERELKLAELKDKLFIAITSDEDGAHYEKTLRYAKYLQDKYPDASKHVLFHTLSGSSGHDNEPIFDFPGEDSIEKFIKEKL